MVDAQNKIQCKSRNHGSKELWQREARALNACLVPPEPSKSCLAQLVLSVLTAQPGLPNTLDSAHLGSESYIQHSHLSVLPEADIKAGTSVIWKAVCWNTTSKTKEKGLEPSGAGKVGVAAL